MKRGELIEFYFKQYRLELETRHAVENRIGFSVGVAVLVAGIPLYYLTNTEADGWTISITVMWLLTGLGSISLLVAGSFLAVAMWSREFRRYNVLGPLDRVEEYRQGFHVWKSRDSGAPNPDSEFDKYVIRQLTTAAARNQNLNVKRALRWHAGTGWLLLSTVFFILAAIPFGIAQGSVLMPFTGTEEDVMLDDEGKPTENEGEGNPVPEPPLRETASEDLPEVETQVDRGSLERKDQP